jgi:hypothetical protein
VYGFPKLHRLTPARRVWYPTWNLNDTNNFSGGRDPWRVMLNTSV